MRNSTLAAAAIAAAVALTAPSQNAAAMPAATPAQLGFPEGPAAALHKTVLICGPWACYWRPNYWGYRPYPYWGWRRRYWGGPGWGWRRPGWGWGWRRPGWGWRRW